MSSLALAVDFGGTKVESAVVDESGRLVARTRFRRPTGPDATLAELAGNVGAVVSDALGALDPDDLARIAGVGIGAAGPIDVARGLASPLNLPVWRDYPFVELVERTAHDVVPGVPVTMRMDGQAIALAEHWVGAARGYGNVLGMIVSTGIGGGLILGGRVLAGPTGNAGHIGHVEVGGHDDPCACGGSGCVEAVASGPKTVAWARRQGWDGSTGEDLARSYAAGDAIARAAVERSGLAIGRAIASAANLVDLDVIAIGGGFSKVSPDLFGFIRAGLAERTGFSFVTRARVEPSALSDDGPLIGAGALVHRSDLVD